MCRIIPVRAYIRSVELRKDFYEEIQFHTNNYLSNSNKLNKIRGSYPFPFKALLVKHIESLIESDKFCIDYFTKLYSLQNKDLVNLQ